MGTHEKKLYDFTMQFARDNELQAADMRLYLDTIHRLWAEKCQDCRRDLCAECVEKMTDPPCAE
jgi:propanediol dehydratase small subunit